MLLFLLLITLSPVICLGFLWPNRNNVVESFSIAHSDAPAPDNDIGNALTAQEVDSLRINYDALQSYSRKPDCFKKAASLIHTRCTELDIDEEERVNAAITMTLCEVATAKHHSLPLECRPYLHNDATGKGRVSSKVQGECVDSLARSAQFWSSYSGYLREVPQLCHAFRRWNDIDSAKDIYRNATIEKIALIRFLKAREKMISKHTDKWSDITSEIGQLVQRMRALSEKHQISTDEFTLQLKDDIDHALQGFWSIAHDIFARQEVSNAQSTSQVTLSDIARTHYDNLSVLVDSFNSLLVSRLDEVLSLHEARHRQMDHSLSILQERWATLGTHFDEIKESVFKLSDHTARLSQDLETTVRGARNIHVLQAEASVAASDLVKTLNHLTETANAGLGQINGSVHLIGQHLQVHIDKAGRTWTNWPVQVLGFIFRADPESFERLERRLSFRLLLSFLGFSWTAFRAIFSTVSSILMVLFFATRRVFIQKSAKMMASVLNQSTPALPLSEQPELKFEEATFQAIGQNAVDLDLHRKPMPGNARFVASRRDCVDNRYRPRLSRIPGRLWSAPAN